jgi:hypothetical protein
MPNGIARGRLGLVVAYNGARALALVPEHAGRGGHLARLVLPGAPANLSASPDGSTLAAVLHDEPPGSWVVMAVDPVLARAEAVFAHDGSRLPAVTSAVSDGRRYFLGAMVGDAIGVLAPIPMGVPR